MIPDVEKLTSALKERKGSILPSEDIAWKRCHAIKLIDCILSLNRRYDSFVVPRLDAFEKTYPDTRTVVSLFALMLSFASPHEFMQESLSYNHKARADTLFEVAKWLKTLIERSGKSEQEALHNWATSAEVIGF